MFAYLFFFLSCDDNFIMMIIILFFCIQFMSCDRSLPRDSPRNSPKENTFQIKLKQIQTNFAKVH